MRSGALVALAIVAQAAKFACALRAAARLTTSQRWKTMTVCRMASTAAGNVAVNALKPPVNDDTWCVLFDCDGVIVETEELHRQAYNKAFESFNLVNPSTKEPVNWSVAYYDILQNTVGGGKPKMFHYFDKDSLWPNCKKSPLQGIPKTDAQKSALVDALQDAKTAFYVQIVEEAATARPGVIQLIDECLNDPNVRVGICSAATKAGFEKLVNSIVGKKRLSRMDVVMAGDDVKKKKPDPMIYNLAREKIGVDASRCIVIEDSLVGLRAAKEAHMKCIITYCESTDKVDFYKEGADAKIPNLGKVGLKDILGPLRANPHAEVLEGLRDAGKVSAPAAAAPVAAAPKAAAPAAAAPKAAAPAAAAPKAAFDAVEQTAIGDLKRRTSTLHESNEASLKQPSRPAAPKAAFDAAEQTAIGDLKRRTSTLHESNEASLKQPSRPAAPKAAFDAAEQTAIGDLKRRTSTLHESNEASLKQPSRPAAPARQLSWYPHAMILKPKLT